MKYEIKLTDGRLVILVDVEKVQLYGYLEIYEFFRTDKESVIYNKKDVFSFVEITRLT